MNITAHMVRTNGDASLQLSLEISRSEVRTSQTQMGIRVQLDNWPQVGEINGPALPQQVCSVALPPGMEVAETSVRVLAQEPLVTEAVRVAPRKPPREDRPSKAFVRHLAVVPDSRLYRRAQQHLRPPARYLTTYMLDDLPIACIEVNPVQVTANQGLALVTQMDVLLRLQPATSVATLPALSEAQRARTVALARAVVVNPQDVPALRSPGPPPPSTVDYLIITDNTTWNATTIQPSGRANGDLVSAFGPLADWRTQRGLKARVITVTNIVNNSLGYGDFVTGAHDLQEVIRKFLQWAYRTWGVAYVLLGGETAIVPVRSISTISWLTDNAPTDFYYAALSPKNNWSEKQTIIYNQCDYTIHMSVGRVAVRSAEQVRHFVDKVIAYEKRPLDDGLPGTTSYQSRVLLAATPWNWDIRTDVTRANAFPPADNQFSHVPGTAQALIKLVEALHVTQAHPANPRDNPGPNRYTHVTGDSYTKLQIQDCYNAIQSIVVQSKNGSTHFLPYNADPGPNKHGWRFDNGTTTFMIVYDDPGELEPAQYIVTLKPEFREPQNLLRVDASGDNYDIPYAVNAATNGCGWYYARSATNLSPSAPSPNLPGQQLATPWVVVYDNPANFTPSALAKYMWDPTEKEGSMMDLEQLRKQIKTEIPRWDTVSRLYLDEVDLPPDDRTAPSIQHYNLSRFVAAMNQGQHIVALNGHGWPTSCCNGIDITLADRLINGPNQSIIHHNGCLTNRFTWAGGSLSNHFVLNPNNGAVAYIGLTDESLIPIGSFFQNQIFHALASNGRLGPAMDSVALLLHQPGTSSDDFRRVIMLYGLTGDPALKVHWARPDYLIATELAVGQNANGGIELLYLRTDGKMYHIREADPNGNWTRASFLDGWARKMVVVPNADRRLEVIYIGTDNKLYHVWQTSPNG
ncbi:MAG: C25 family cysteine peptidase, partial [Chloroflexaceae bacterium]|nr:C25 family cysteine peptidase [Chloroflexaceae bacterium]